MVMCCVPATSSRPARMPLTAAAVSTGWRPGADLGPEVVALHFTRYRTIREYARRPRSRSACTAPKPGSGTAVAMEPNRA